MVVPALNEAKNLPHVLGLLPADVHEIVLVDGRSTDDTIAVARSLRPDIKVVVQNRRGKGNALACGFAACTGDVIVTLDADGSADPREIDRFTAALLAGADFAKGSRFVAGGGSADITRLRRAGNGFLNLVVNALYRSRFTDLCYGYNAFWRDVCLDLNLDVGEAADEKRWGDGFEIETLLNVRATAAGLRIVEVASYEHARIHGVSNLNAASDGLRVLRTIAMEKRLARRRQRFVTLPQQQPVATIALDELDACASTAGGGAA